MQGYNTPYGNNNNRYNQNNGRMNNPNMGNNANNRNYPNNMNGNMNNENYPGNMNNNFNNRNYPNNMNGSMNNGNYPSNMNNNFNNGNYSNNMNGNMNNGNYSNNMNGNMNGNMNNGNYPGNMNSNINNGRFPNNMNNTSFSNGLNNRMNSVNDTSFSNNTGFSNNMKNDMGNNHFRASFDDGNSLPEKKTSTGMIVAIAIGVMVLVSAGIFLFYNMGKKADKSGQKKVVEQGSSATAGTTLDGSSSEDSDVEYTKGEVKEGVYTNEWLGAEFTIPTEYTVKEDKYSELSSTTEECIFYAEDSEKNTILFSVADLTNYGDYTANEVLQSIEKTLKDYSVRVDYEDIKEENKTIGGREYVGKHYKCVSSSKTIAYQSVYVTKIGKRFVTLTVANAACDVEKNNSILDGVVKK